MHPSGLRCLDGGITRETVASESYVAGDVGLIYSDGTEIIRSKWTDARLGRPPDKTETILCNPKDVE